MRHRPKGAILSSTTTLFLRDRMWEKIERDLSHTVLGLGIFIWIVGKNVFYRPIEIIMPRGLGC